MNNCGFGTLARLSSGGSSVDSAEDASDATKRQDAAVDAALAKADAQTNDAELDDAEMNEAGIGDAAADVSDDADAGVFATSCPSGTVYAEPFTTNPLSLGTWIALIGQVTYDSTNDLLALAVGAPNTQAWIGARPNWANYIISVQVRIDAVGPTNTPNGGVNFRMVNPGPMDPPNDSGMMYFAGISPGDISLGMETNGSYTLLQSVKQSFSTTPAFHTLTISAIGSVLSVSADGTNYITVTDSTYPSGGIGFRTYDTAMSYESLSVTCQ
jgi:hypothetical protein